MAAATNNKEPSNERDVTEVKGFDPKTIAYKHNEEQQQQQQQKQANMEQMSSTADANNTNTTQKVKFHKEEHPGVSIVKKPMMLNVGQGTTGTRFLADALCNHLKITSVHWTAYCHDDRAAAFDEYIWNSQKHFKQAHRRVIDIFYTMQYCIEDYNRDNVEVCSIEQTLQMFQNLKEAIKDVVLSGGTTALLDTPYTRVIPFVRSTIEELTGVPPLLVMTKRDPFHWAERRFDEIEHVEILCRSIFESDQPPDGSYDPFDLSWCLANAFEQKDSLPRMFSDVFTSNVRVKEDEMKRLIAEQRKKEQEEMANSSGEEEEDAMVNTHFLRGGNASTTTDGSATEEKKVVFGAHWKEHVLTKVAHAMNVFQQMYEPLTCYHVDLFENSRGREERISSEALAQDIYQTLVSSSNNNHPNSLLSYQCQEQAKLFLNYGEGLQLWNGPELQFGEV